MRASRLWIIDTNTVQRNIIPLLAFERTPALVIRVPFIGPDLGAFQDENHLRTLSDIELDSIQEGVFEALSHLKASEVVHQDIKLKSVLWSRQGRKAVLVDFGMACKANECTSKADFGTPCYLPPEVALSIKRSYAGDM